MAALEEGRRFFGMMSVEGGDVIQNLGNVYSSSYPIYVLKNVIYLSVFLQVVYGWWKRNQKSGRGERYLDKCEGEVVSGIE